MQKIQTLIVELKKLFSVSGKAAFIFTVVVGLITHLSIMILQPEQADSIISAGFFKAGEYQLYSQGRWGTNLLNCFRGYLVIPTLTVLITILSISLAAVLLADLFDISNKLFAAMIGAALVVHPYIANAMFYYAISGTFIYALCVISVWLLYRKNMNLFYIMLSVFLEVICLSYNQAYLCVFTTLGLMMFAIDLLKGKNLKESFRYLGYSVIACALSGALYFVIWKFLSKIHHITYFYGMSSEFSAGQVFRKLPQSIINTYRAFCDYFFGNSFINNSFWNRELIYGLLFVILLVLFCIIVRINKLKYVNRTVLVCTLLVMPIALSVIQIVVTDYAFYLMMATGFLFIIPFFCKVIDLCDLQTGFVRVIKGIAMVTVGLVLWTYILSDNAGYMLLNQTTNQSKQLAERLLYQIETFEGFDSEMEVCFIGDLNEAYFATSDVLSMASPGGTFNNKGVWFGVWEVSDGWGKYIEQYCGVKLNYLTNGSQERIRTLTATDAFKELDIYPSDHSLEIIDGTLVVKLGEFVY